MTYCTQQDLIDRFGERELIELTDRTNKPVSTIDDTTVERALGDAEATADSYIGTVYQLPIPTVPPILTKICADIARYFLYGKVAEKDTPVEIAYRDALAWLTGVSKRLITIENAGAIVSQLGGGQVQANTGDATLTKDSMKGFV